MHSCLLLCFALSLLYYFWTRTETHSGSYERLTTVTTARAAHYSLMTKIVLATLFCSNKR
jgi:hypothetical protein